MSGSLVGMGRTRIECLGSDADWILREALRLWPPSDHGMTDHERELGDNS